MAVPDSSDVLTGSGAGAGAGAGDGDGDGEGRGAGGRDAAGGGGGATKTVSAGAGGMVSGSVAASWIGTRLSPEIIPVLSKPSVASPPPHAVVTPRAITSAADPKVRLIKLSINWG